MGFDRGHSSIDIKPVLLAANGVARINPAQNQICIGHGGAGIAKAVANRAWV